MTFNLMNKMKLTKKNIVLEHIAYGPSSSCMSTKSSINLRYPVILPPDIRTASLSFQPFDIMITAV